MTTLNYKFPPLDEVQVKYVPTAQAAHYLGCDAEDLRRWWRDDDAPVRSITRPNGYGWDIEGIRSHLANGKGFSRY